MMEMTERDLVHGAARVEHLIRCRDTELPKHGDLAFANAVRRMCSAFGLDSAPYLEMLEPDLGDSSLPMGANMVLVTGEPRPVFVPLEIDGNPIWRHECGAQQVMRPNATPDYCVACDGRGATGRRLWRQLYVQGGA